MSPNQVPEDSLDGHHRKEQREILRRARLDHQELGFLGRSVLSETQHEDIYLRVVEPRDAVEADSELEGDDVEGHRRKNGRI